MRGAGRQAGGLTGLGQGRGEEGCLEEATPVLPSVGEGEEERLGEVTRGRFGGLGSPCDQSRAGVGTGTAAEAVGRAIRISGPPGTTGQSSPPTRSYLALLPVTRGTSSAKQLLPACLPARPRPPWAAALGCRWRLPRCPASPEEAWPLPGAGGQLPYAHGLATPTSGRIRVLGHSCRPTRGPRCCCWQSLCHARLQRGGRLEGSRLPGTTRWVRYVAEPTRPRGMAVVSRTSGEREGGSFASSMTGFTWLSRVLVPGLPRPGRRGRG